MALYDFFVGSTARHAAHRDSHELSPAIPNSFSSAQYVYGVWEGEVEKVAQYTIELADDATAQRIAYALSVLTGNDAVLVSRLAIKGEESLVFGSTRAYRVSTEVNVGGNGTALIPNGARWAYVPDSRGSHVAYLVWSDARVTAVD